MNYFPYFVESFYKCFVHFHCYLQSELSTIDMSRQYDTKTTIFSPEGRLYQVEYAMEAINHAGNCLGLLASDGILLAAEYRLVTPLLDEAGFSEKIYRLDKHIACSVAGITGDANVLTEYLRTTAQRHVIKYGEPIPVEQLVQSLSDVKQRYTQFGGLRPFGVSLLYMGWDKHYKYQLYQSDPSGNYSGWKATCIGKNQQQAMSQLRQEYKERQLPTLQEAKALAIKVFSKTIDAAKLSVDTVEIATLQRPDAGEDEPVTKVKMMDKDELRALIEEHDALLEVEKQADKAKGVKDKPIS